MDFSHQPNREGERGVVVRTYMAHHQGMGFLSLANFLQDNCHPATFHADPRVRAVEPLLHERIPHLPPLHQISTRARVIFDCGDRRSRTLGEPVRYAPYPHAQDPAALQRPLRPDGHQRRRRLQPLGRLRNHALEVGPDPRSVGDVLLHPGMRIRTGCGATPISPPRGKVEGYSVDFSLDRAVFRRVDNDIEIETEIIVAPEDDVEIRRMTLINRSLRTRRLDLTSYVELSMAPHNADRQHPAFNKLFIQTEAVPAAARAPRPPAARGRKSEPPVVCRSPLHARAR